MPSSQLPILWAALAVSQLIYLGIPIPADERRLPDVFAYALAVVAIVEATGIVLMLRVALFAPLRDGRLDPATKDGAARLFTFLLLAWVLAESIAIYGLVLRFLQFERAYSLPFAIGAALVMYLARPWSAKLRKAPTTADLARSGAPLP